MQKLDNKDIKWRYQIIDHGTVENPDFRVHEVYFNAVNKHVASHTVNAVSLQGYESKEEIIKDLELIIQDLKSADNKVLEIDKLNELFQREK
ncbi:hypothetical protein [Paenimyroides ceti]